MGIAEVGNGLTIIQVKELPYLDSIHEFTSQTLISSGSSEAGPSEGADITALVQSASSLAVAAWPPQELADFLGSTFCLVLHVVLYTCICSLSCATYCSDFDVVYTYLQSCTCICSTVV